MEYFLPCLTLIAIIYAILPERKVKLIVDKPVEKPRNLLRLAGVINAANTEADNEAGELIERVRKNQSRTLALVAKGHKNELLREQMLSEAEREQALADLEAAIGDNGGPLLEEEPDPNQQKIRDELKQAKSGTTSKPSLIDTLPPETATPTPVPTPPEVGEPPFQP